MRYVLRNADEVMHYWANQVQSEGRAGNVSFDGTSLYSYAARIAEIVVHKGHRYAVHVHRTWSPTTSRHQCYARSASSHLENLHILRFSLNPTGLKADTEKEVVATLGKAKRARSNKGWYEKRALDLVEHFNKYMEITGGTPRIHDVDLDGLRVSIAQYEAEMEGRAAKQQAKQLAEAAEGIEKWRRYQQHHCPRTPKPLLRLGADDGVETSFGATISRDDALKLWPLIQRAMRGERDYEVGMDVGVYRLTKIRRDGSLVVGCHDIAYGEIEGIAKELGLLEEAPA